MKKLLAGFLAGAFLLSSVNVLANDSIENAELNSVRVILNGYQIKLNEALLDIQNVNSQNKVNFMPFRELLEYLGYHIEFNSETNNIEISEQWYFDMLTRNEAIQIIEPIDVDNINYDEWIASTFLYLLGGSREFDGTMFGHLGSGSDTEYTFNHAYDHNARFTSIIGCNTSDIRGFRVDPWTLFLNIQDLLESGIFSDEELAEIKDLIELERTYGTFEGYLAARNFDNIQQLIISGEFTNEELAYIAELFKLQIAYR